MAVAKDTYIFTDQGIIPIYLLNKYQNNIYSYEEDINYNIISMNDIIQTKKLIQLNTSDLIQIQVQNNYILKGTENHKIKILQNDILEWKELKNIQLNDLVAIKINNDIKINNEAINKNDIDKLLLENIDYIDDIDRVLESSKDIQKYFLQQYFNKYMYLIDNTIQIITQNINILKQLQILLLYFKILSRIDTNTLYIDSKYWNNFQTYIDISDVQKKIYLQNFAKSEYIDDQYIYLPVEKIDYLSPEIVYTFELDNNDIYIGNGFINQC